MQSGNPHTAYTKNAKKSYFDRLLANEWDSAQQLKRDTLAQVKHLYRYRPLSGFGLDELITGQAYMAKPEQLNDPYECRYLFNHQADEIRLGTAYGAYHYFHKDVRIAALCENPKSILMWAHYANRPKGCCLEFTTKEFLRHKQIALGLSPVIYPTSLFDANKVLRTQPPERLKQILLSTTCTKLSSWSYEQEWRLIHLRVAEPSNKDSAWPGPLVPLSKWAPNLNIEEQSQLIGYSDEANHFIDLPTPSRIILFGDNIDRNLERLIRGVRRLANVKLALAKLTPDAKPNAELEIEDVS